MKIYIILLVIPFLITSFELKAQENSDTKTMVRELALFESWALVSGFSSQYPTGARIIGTINGLTGFFVISSSYLESTPLSFSIPFSLGLMSLSTYNFVNVSSLQKSNMFWVNYGGYHVTALITLVCSYYYESQVKNYSLQLNNNSIKYVYYFK